MNTAPVLFVLQNQWFKDPERARRVLAAGVEKFGQSYRQRFLVSMLFAGGLTGRRLDACLGPWADVAAYEEASPQIGGNAASVFPADIPHLQAALDRVQPAMVVAFGKVAGDAMAGMSVCHGGEEGPPWLLIRAPHPAARHPGTFDELRLVRAKLDAWALPGSLAKPETIIASNGGFCRKCWNGGRALWASCCKCTGDVS